MRTSLCLPARSPWRLRAAGLAACGLLLPAGAADAQQDYPARPIRLITGYLPGGVSDTLARVVGEKLGERLGQRVVVDGRPGAGGVISMELAVNAAPDGYTLFLGQPLVTISPNFRRKLAFDPVRGLAPLCQIGSSPTILTGSPGLPAGSIRELIDLAKAKPRSLNFSSSGVGSTNHLAGELFNIMAGVQLVHVPYKGAGAALPAVISGEVQLGFGPLLAAIQHVRAGRLKGLGVTGSKRTSALPEVPAIAETVPGFDVSSWYGIMAPAALPRPLAQRLNGEIDAVLARPDVRERLAAQGVDVVGGSIESFAALVRRDAAQWARLVRDAGIVID